MQVVVVALLLLLWNENLDTSRVAWTSLLNDVSIPLMKHIWVYVGHLFPSVL